MKFKVTNKANIKLLSGDFITVMPGEFVKLPSSYIIHPDLEKVVETEKVAGKGNKTVPKGLDKNNDGVISDKEVAQYMGAKGGRKSRGKRTKK